MIFYFLGYLRAKSISMTSPVLSEPRRILNGYRVVGIIALARRPSRNFITLSGLATPFIALSISAAGQQILS